MKKEKKGISVVWVIF